jgi:predicted Zn-ribbon and HTH transcriptional regulator
MVTYTCKSCGFKTEIKVGIPKKCPYCGEQGSVRQEENAEELLEEN